MNKFKIGDWVRHNGRVLKVVKHTEYSSISSTDSYHKVSEIHCNDSFNGKFYKLWQPQQGEWCWFEAIDLDQSDKSYWMFGKYQYDNFFIVDYLDEQIPFINCEPFIGELPSFIKEK